MDDRRRPRLPSVSLGDVVSREPAIPDLVTVRRVRGPAPPALDIRAAVAEQLREPMAAVRPGETVAVAVGSRGIARLPEIVTSVVDLLLEAGAQPFLLPAMGSHGGATEAGQTAVLAELGVTSGLGAPVRASMETTVLGTADDVEVHVSVEAARADHVLLVNRVKSHTSFTGRIESGLAKMTAVGLGKQRGAEELHRLGPLQLERRLLAAAGLIRDRLALLGGLAIVEGDDKQVRSLTFVAADDIGGQQEATLLELARTQEARLPFEEIDVLVVDVMGKEISGTGMDTNVLGRRMVRGSPEPPGIRITNVVVLEVTTGSEGNAIGLGLADFVPVSLLERVDLAATYANALTAGLQGVQRAQLPIALADDRDTIAAALLTAGLADPQGARMVRIRSTLHLDQLMVTPNLLATTDALAPVASAEPRPMFDDAGRLAPWPTTPEGAPT